MSTYVRRLKEIGQIWIYVCAYESVWFSRYVRTYVHTYEFNIVRIFMNMRTFQSISAQFMNVRTFNQLFCACSWTCAHP